MFVNMTKQTCPICLKTEKLIVVANRLWDSARRKIVCCSGCGVYYLNPMMTNKELRVLYAKYEAYTKRREPSIQAFRTLRQRQKIEAGRQLKYIRPYLRKSQRILEVGASYGAFSRLITPFVKDVIAVEPGPAARARLSRAKISNYKTIGDIPCDDKFNAVAMFHTIEHLNDPVNYLKNLRSLIAPGALVFIETPNLDDSLLTLYQIPEFFKFYFREEHCFYFTPKTLQTVFWQAGFRHEKTLLVQRYGIANHLHWLITGKSGGDKRLARIFADTDVAYRAELVKNGISDTIFSIFRTS